MRESSPPGAPAGSTGAPAHASGEIVHEQTVRAPIPVGPSETTVRVPMPTPPPQEQTVRAFVPSAAARSAAAAHEVEELEEVDVEPEAEPSDPQLLDVSALVSELEAQVRSRGVEHDAPVARSEQITVPEAAATPAAGEPSRGASNPRPRRKRPRDEGPALRPEPPAVSGEVSVSDPEPDGLFDPAAPRRDPRARTAPARTPKVRRGDPPVVSGEVAIDPATTQSPEVPAADVRVMPMTASGPQAVMTASGSHPVMTASGPQSVMTSSGSHPIMTASGASPVVPQGMMASSGSHPIMTASGTSPVVPRRTSTDSGYGVGADVTGSQPRLQADPTGPHPLLLRSRESSHDSLVLWVLAGTLVVLAVGVVMMVISWTR